MIRALLVAAVVVLGMGGCGSKSEPAAPSSSTKIDLSSLPVTLEGELVGYERGEFTRIPMRYDSATDTVTIGARAGGYSGMVKDRMFNVRWIREGRKAPSVFEAKADRAVHYDGSEIEVKP